MGRSHHTRGKQGGRVMHSCCALAAGDGQSCVMDENKIHMVCVFKYSPCNPHAHMQTLLFVYLVSFQCTALSLGIGVSLSVIVTKNK